MNKNNLIYDLRLPATIIYWYSWMFLLGVILFIIGTIIESIR